MTLFVRASTSRRARAKDEPRAAHDGRRGRTIAGTEIIDEAIEIHRGRLHVRAEQSAWVDVADASLALRGHPICFVTPELVGYLTIAGADVVAVVGVCSRCGCLLQLDAPAQALWCPSSGTVYRPDGRVADAGRHYRPVPLPLVQARRADGRLQALVPRALAAS